MVPQPIQTLPTIAARTTAEATTTISPFPGGAEPETTRLSVPTTLPHALTNPAWLSRPDADQVARAYPERALGNGVGGLVTLACDVTAAGTVVHCDVVSESPQGYEFSRAALSLSRYFRMKPATDDGNATRSMAPRSASRSASPSPARSSDSGSAGAWGR